MGLRTGANVKDYRGGIDGGKSIVKIEGSNYEVYDGDTAYKLDDDNNRILGADGKARGLRIQGIQARETEKVNPHTGGLDLGEVGGNADKHVLFEYLKNNADNLSFTKLKDQEVGRGAGNRDEVDFVNKNTGYGLAAGMAEEGLTRKTSWESEEARLAREDGEFKRSLKYGETFDPLSGTHRANAEDKNRDLRNLVGQTHVRDDGYQPFKTKSINEKWFDPDLHSGVEFRNKNTTLSRKEGESGFTTTPYGTAWDVGWASVYSDAGAFINSLGVGFDSQKLQDYGNSVRIRNEQIKNEKAPFAIQQLSDIETDEGIMTALGDGVEWLGVNTAMSLPYMAAIAGAGVAAAVSSPLSGTALLASAPAFAIHAGTIWNDIDPDKRTKDNLGRTYTAALGNTVLDRIGFAGIIKPTSVLTKEGISTLSKKIALRDGITEAQAKKLISRTGKEEVEKFLKHNVDVADEFLKRNKVVNDVLKEMATSAPKEAVTETLQEVNSYITAQGINGDPVDDRELLNIIANSAAAGFAIGGGLGGAAQIPKSFSAKRQRRRWTEDWDPEAQESYLSTIEAEEDALGIPDDQRGNDKDLIAIRAAADADTSVPEGYTDSLSRQGEGSNLLNDLFVDEDNNFRVPGVGEASSRVGKTVGRLGRAATRNEVKAEDMKNPGLRSIYKLVDFSGGGGRNFEAFKSHLEGTFQNVMGARDSFGSLGLVANKKNAKSLSHSIRSLNSQGLLKKLREAGFVYDRLTDADKKAFDNTTGKLDSRATAEVVRKLNNSTETMYQSELNAIQKEYGVNSKQAKSFQANKVEDYYANKTEVDRNKVARDVKAFEEYVKIAINNKLNDTNVSSSQKDQIRKLDPTEISLKIMEDGNTEVFSLVGGQKIAGSGGRLLDLASIPGFTDKFGEENMFASLSQLSRDTAKRVSHMEYFGDGGRLLDFLLDKAIRHEVDVNGLTLDQAQAKIAKVAADYKNLIDASSNNYRRIKSPTVAKLQRTLMTYTSFVGLPLAALASTPEFGTIAFDLRSSDEFHKAIGHTLGAMKTQLWKLIKLPIGALEDATVVGGIKETKRSKVVQDEMFNQMQQAGIPVDVSDVYNKWGMEGGEPVSDFWRNAHETFFKATLIEPITYTQRVINTGMSLDFMRDRLDILMNHTEGTPFKRIQGEAYYDLKALGMNVDGVLKKLKERGDNANELGYDVNLGTSTQAEVNAVSSVQEKANANGVTYEQQVVEDILNSNSGDIEGDRFINDQIAIVTQNFVNQRIQNPGAANRPLLFQDPRFALLTQFNGFISTVTTTLVPKLWNGKVGAGIRTKNPDLVYEAFQTVVILVALGALGQFLKDIAKGSEDDYDPTTHKYFDTPALIQRAFMSSGIFGQFEKPLSWVLPSQFERDQSIGARAGSDFVGPNVRHLQNIQGFIEKGLTGTTEEGPNGGTYEVKPDLSRGLNELLKSGIVTSIRPDLRHKIAGMDTSKWEK